MNTPPPPQHQIDLEAQECHQRNLGVKLIPLSMDPSFYLIWKGFYSTFWGY